MAASSVTKIRTVFLHVLRAILAYFGFAAPATAGAGGHASLSTGAPVLTGRVPAQGHAAVPPPYGAGGRLVAQRSPLSGERSLPPTIKQRIRAEAHGSSPSVRRVACGGDGDEIAAEVSRGRFSAVLGAPRGTNCTPGAPGTPGTH